ncbi:uncharacterized protein LAESUDRAFT_762174 [Laetiporus sulphureus 93-53]|uniref:F-box domain-containing protein n=1 Tax=Laetiporus sulphureus 93-53 TaxID=1314785 RepID=A0A165CPN5_9APHY|nr:uncharacterized protein LAESUDRAFT_762174 [Laetiporus sulphureus 93-53]KZT03192.1 hypothetical protein LAESUDRAFT_762174 [Laetiporus sulphureus 93-53]
MATQRVLQAYDILELIFLSIRDGTRKGDLARAARVCKAFFLPAVKLLWERMYDLLPLFKIFEGLHPTEGGFSHRKELAYCFCRPISPQEWTRYKLYSQCIKSAFFSRQKWTIHPSALEYMSKTNGGAPLLPAVQHFEWEQISPLDFSMNKFTSSMMRVFAFKYLGEELSHGSSMTTDNAMEFHMKLLFDDLSVKAHSLEEITIYGIDQLSSLLSFSICNRLRKVHLTIESTLDPAVLTMFASFKSLTQLTWVVSIWVTQRLSYTWLL